MATIENSRSCTEGVNSKVEIKSSRSEPLWTQMVEVLQTIGDVFSFIIRFWWLVGKAIFRLIVPVAPKSVKGEIVLITGAGNGIGRELAFQYASQGATVVCWDINEKGNLETVEEIRRLGYPKAHAYVCNVVNREEVLKTAETVQKEVGDVTILINNAGIMPSHPFLDHTKEEIERIMSINVMSHFWTLQAVLPTMVKNNYGHIVAISSLAGLMGLRNLVPYCASKFAVKGLMESLYLDLHADPKCQINLTCICPYAVRTGLFDVGNIRSNFPKLFPTLNAKYVAEYIMNAQRRNVFETTIPRHFLSFLYYGKLFPVSALLAFHEFADTYVGSDL